LFKGLGDMASDSAFDDYWREPGGRVKPPVSFVLNVARVVIREIGYVPKKAASFGKRPTADAVSHIVYLSMKRDQESLAKADREVIKEARELDDWTPLVLKWVDKQIAAKGWSDFLNNVKAAVEYEK